MLCEIGGAKYIASRKVACLSLKAILSPGYKAKAKVSASGVDILGSASEFSCFGTYSTMNSLV